MRFHPRGLRFLITDTSNQQISHITLKESMQWMTTFSWNTEQGQRLLFLFLRARNKQEHIVQIKISSPMIRVIDPDQRFARNSVASLRTYQLFTFLLYFLERIFSLSLMILAIYLYIAFNQDMNSKSWIIQTDCWYFFRLKCLLKIHIRFFGSLDFGIAHMIR